MKSDKSQIDRLIYLCKKKDRKAQKEIYELFSPKVLGIVYRYIPDYDTANEVLQLTFIKMFNELAGFRGDNFMGWLSKIAINTSLNMIKKNKKYDQMQDIHDVTIHEKIVSNTYSQDDADDIIKIITTLPREERTLFNLRAIDGYSFKEIGEMLSMTEANSRVKYHRVRAKLADFVKKIV